MTWTKFNTITFSTTSDYGAFHTYLFGTALPGHGWTVTAHPSAGSFKRSLNYTATNWYTNANDTRRFWVDWSSATNASFSMYADKTFTTNPGDLGTYNSLGQTFTSNITGYTSSNWTFWESSENPNALLVLRGKAVVFYWPGHTSWGAWNANDQLNATYIFPANNANGAFPVVGPPVFPGSNTTSSTTAEILNGYTSRSTANAATTDALLRGFTAFVFYSSNVYDLLFHVADSDTRVYIPKAKSSSTGSVIASTGQLVYDGTNYHYASSSSASALALWFNMGSVEPTF